MKVDQESPLPAELDTGMTVTNVMGCVLQKGCGEVSRSPKTAIYVVKPSLYPCKFIKGQKWGSFVPLQLAYLDDASPFNIHCPMNKEAFSKLADQDSWDYTP